VKLPMILKIDNKGFVDFRKSWTMARRMWHIDCQYYLLRELREAGYHRGRMDGHNEEHIWSIYQEHR
jgi:hypothetical protein